MASLPGELDPVGDDHVVVVETKTNERINLAAMRERVAESVWKPFLISTSTSYVKTERKHIEAKARDII